MTEITVTGTRGLARRQVAGRQVAAKQIEVCVGVAGIDEGASYRDEITHLSGGAAGDEGSSSFAVRRGLRVKPAAGSLIRGRQDGSRRTCQPHSLRAHR